MPLLWTQSLTWLSDLLLAGLINPDDLDPTGRRRPSTLGADRVLVALVPANAAIAASLEAAGLPLAHGPSSTNPAIRIGGSQELAMRMAQVGANPALGLSGHPPVRMETMATARLYRQGTSCFAFFPAVLEEDTFYLADDPEQLVDAVTAELRLLQRHWRGSGSPLLLLPIAEGAFQANPDAFLRLGQQLQAGQLDGVPVQLAPLAELIDQGSWVELPDQAPGAVLLPPAPIPTPLRAGTSQTPLAPRRSKNSNARTSALANSPIGSGAAAPWKSRARCWSNWCGA